MFQETFKIRETEEIDEPQCKDTNKTECVFLKNNYNSIDFTEVEQIDEAGVDPNGTEVGIEDKPLLRPKIGPILEEVFVLE